MSFPSSGERDIGDVPECGPVRRVELRGGEAWLVTRHDDVRSVASSPRFSRVLATKPGTPSVWPDFHINEGLLYMDPPDHGRVRKLVAAGFTPRRVEALRPRVREIVDRLLDRLEDHGPPADLLRLVAVPLPTLVIAEVLGLPRADHDKFWAWTTVLTDDTLPGDVTERTFHELYAYLRALIDDKRAHPADDVLSAMIHACEDGERLSEAELLQNTQGFIFAGQDSTVNMLSNSVVTLLRHPEQLALLLARPELLDGAVEELLRYVPTLVGSATRVATVDTPLNGATISTGSAVITVEAAANRDPEVYEDATRFDITRNPAHLSFGHGPHYCIGASLARLELTVALGGLLHRFPGLRLAGEVQWLPNRLFYTPREIPIAW